MVEASREVQQGLIPVLAHGSNNGLDGLLNPGVGYRLPGQQGVETVSEVRVRGG